MWYRNTVKKGAEFIIVDADKKTRKVAFDHQRIADAISSKDTSYEALNLPFRTFKYIKNGRSISFDLDNKTYTCNLRNYRCTYEKKEKSRKSNVERQETFRSNKTDQQKKIDRQDLKKRMKKLRKRYKNQRTKFLNDWKSENESKRLKSRACHQEFAINETLEHEKFPSNVTMSPL